MKPTVSLPCVRCSVSDWSYSTRGIQRTRSSKYDAPRPRFQSYLFYANINMKRSRNRVVRVEPVIGGTPLRSAHPTSSAARKRVGWAEAPSPTNRRNGLEMPDHRRWYVPVVNIFLYGRHGPPPTDIAHRVAVLLPARSPRRRSGLTGPSNWSPSSCFRTISIRSGAFHPATSGIQFAGGRIKDDFMRRYPKGGRQRDSAKCLPNQTPGERGIWQRRYWEHTVRDEEDLKRCVDYVHWKPKEARTRDQCPRLALVVVSPLRGIGGIHAGLGRG